MVGQNNSFVIKLFLIICMRWGNKITFFHSDFLQKSFGLFTEAKKTKQSALMNEKENGLSKVSSNIFCCGFLFFNITFCHVSHNTHITIKNLNAMAKATRKNARLFSTCGCLHTNFCIDICFCCFYFLFDFKFIKLVEDTQRRDERKRKRATIVTKIHIQSHSTANHIYSMMYRVERENKRILKCIYAYKRTNALNALHIRARTHTQRHEKSTFSLLHLFV